MRAHGVLLRTARWVVAAAAVGMVSACGARLPETLVARRGNVLAAVWETTEVGRARRLLRQWLAAADVAPPTRSDGPDRNALLALLPATGAIPGWEVAGTRRYYSGEEMAGFVGRAFPAFHAFGVQGLATAEYRNPRLDPKPEMRVEAYDMGSADGAFGLYAYRRVRESEFRSIGAEASVGALELVAWKAQYVVYVRVYEFASDTKEAMVAAARWAMARVAGETKTPGLAGVLPLDGVVARSERTFRTFEQARFASARSELLLLPLSPDVSGLTASVESAPGAGAEAVCLVFPRGEDALGAMRILRDTLAATHRLRNERLGDDAFRATRLP